MSLTPNTAGRIVWVVVSCAAIMLYQFTFARRSSESSLLYLFWPPSVAWVACIIFAYLVAESVRRAVRRQQEDAKERDHN